MNNAVFYSEWLEHDGKSVKIEGLSYTLRVRTYEAAYPYRHTAINVYAEPANRRSKAYLKAKQELGDDWDTDVLASDLDLQASILSQLRD